MFFYIWLAKFSANERTLYNVTSNWHMLSFTAFNLSAQGDVFLLQIFTLEWNLQISQLSNDFRLFTKLICFGVSHN